VYGALAEPFPVLYLIQDLREIGRTHTVSESNPIVVQVAKVGRTDHAEHVSVAAIPIVRRQQPRTKI